MTAEEAMERIVEAMRTRAALGPFAVPDPVLSSTEQLREIRETVRLYTFTRPTR